MGSPDMANLLGHGRTLLLPGVELWDFAATIAVVSDAEPLRAAAAAPLGAGVGWRRTLLAHRFAPDYHGAAPAADLSNVADRLQLPQPRAGFPAAARMELTHLVNPGPPATATVAVVGDGPPGVLAVVGGSLSDADLVDLLLVVWTVAADGPPPLVPAGVVVAARRGGRRLDRPAAGVLVRSVRAVLTRSGDPAQLTGTGPDPRCGQAGC